MKNVKIVNCMKGSAWMFPSGIAPFGNSRHFLHKNQIRPVGNKKVKPLENDYYTIISNYSHCPVSRVNFVLNPKKSYSDPMRELFDKSLLERNLEKM